jgi:hypothetical protein
MINTKSKENQITSDERRLKVLELRQEHQPYFDAEHISDAIFIPKMAYRPPGKDELHISFFASELQKTQDIYTEFVSSAYECEDPKRTLYLFRHNPFWSDEYELIVSNAGFQRYLLPVSELKIINDITNRGKKKNQSKVSDNEIENPEWKYSNIGIVDALDRITGVLTEIKELIKKK